MPPQPPRVFFAAGNADQAAQAAAPAADPAPAAEESSGYSPVEQPKEEEHDGGADDGGSSASAAAPAPKRPKTEVSTLVAAPDANNSSEGGKHVFTYYSLEGRLITKEFPVSLWNRVSEEHSADEGLSGADKKCNPGAVG